MSTSARCGLAQTTASLIALLTLTAILGCSAGQDDDRAAANDATDEAAQSDDGSSPAQQGVTSPGTPNVGDPETAAQAIDQAGGKTASMNTASAVAGDPTQLPAVVETTPGSDGASDGTPEIIDAPAGFELAPAVSGPSDGDRRPEADGVPELKADLGADQLAEVLEKSDVEMELIASGRARMKDPEAASQRMIEVARLKLTAARRLSQHPDATERQRVDGLRGQLQALSHLTAMGDAASAKALRSLAEDNLESEDAAIAGDSRIVLIGLGIDAFQAGDTDAADEIVALIEAMQPNPSADVPAVLVMAEARQMLANYGLIDQAAKIRDKILTLYGNSSDPMIAQVAADAAGTTKFDVTTRLLSAILENDQVAMSRWTEAVSELVAKAPEMNTVQFLASAALQLEAAGRDAFVEETFRILSEQFTDPQAATTAEVETAKNAMRARQDVIGSAFDFSELPSVPGQSVSPEDYEDKVVLMPFWAITIPESLQLVRSLKEIRDRYPERVSIIGINLDPEQAPLQEFLAANEMGFPSFRSVSSSTESVANPMAARFGLVSLPFVAILDRDGTVAALDFTGRKLAATVEGLVQTSSNQGSKPSPNVD